MFPLVQAVDSFDYKQRPALLHSMTCRNWPNVLSVHVHSTYILSSSQVLAYSALLLYEQWLVLVK
jgi:hypothetical protein